MASIYCTKCGEELIVKNFEYSRKKRFHPMTGQKQFKHETYRLCPNKKSICDDHHEEYMYGAWIDLKEKE